MPFSFSIVRIGLPSNSFQAANCTQLLVTPQLPEKLFHSFVVTKVTLRFNEARDKDIITYLEKIPDGDRNVAVKNIVRRHCKEFIPDLLENNGATVLNVKLSPAKDRDLICAYRQLGNNTLTALVKTAIRMHGNGKPTQVSVSYTRTDMNPVSLQIPLDPKKDADILAVISTLLPDMIGAYVKILLRSFIVVDYENIPEGDYPESVETGNDVKFEKESTAKIPDTSEETYECWDDRILDFFNRLLQSSNELYHQESSDNPDYRINR